MPERVYVARLSGTDRVRVRIELDQGQVLAFVIQYETWADRGFRPAVHYDTSHGRPHRDTLNRRGDQIDKAWLPEHWTLAEALTRAQADVRANWEIYRERFMRQE